jgi:alkyl hydroperoxide reductase subunit AhpC
MYEKMFSLLLQNPIKVGEKIFKFEETDVLYSKEFVRITSDQLLEKLIILFAYSLDFTFLCRI